MFRLYLNWYMVHEQDYLILVMAFVHRCNPINLLEFRASSVFKISLLSAPFFSPLPHFVSAGYAPALMVHICTDRVSAFMPQKQYFVSDHRLKWVNCRLGRNAAARTHHFLPEYIRQHRVYPHHRVVVQLGTRVFFVAVFLCLLGVDIVVFL